MAISYNTLYEYGRQITENEIITNFSRAKRHNYQTAFLSHSHKDVTAAKGVQKLLNEQGWEVYIDWEDTTMPETPNRQTAEKIQEKIRECDWFLFLATYNSMNSRWCPWEIGYGDGVKQYERILIIPTQQNYTTYGSEYLQLYKHINTAQEGGYGAFYPNGRGQKLQHIRL